MEWNYVVRMQVDVYARKIFQEGSHDVIYKTGQLHVIYIFNLPEKAQSYSWNKFGVCVSFPRQMSINNARYID